MNLGAPMTDVTPGARGALLQALVRLEQPVTRRRLAAIAGVAPGNASSVVEDLVSTGLVTDIRAGRSSMVALNRHHLAAASISALTGLRGELIRRLRERLNELPGILGGWLFGSVARGEAGRDSDIDVLLVATDLEAPELSAGITRLHSDVRTWTGNDLQIVEHSVESWNTLKVGKNALVEQIRIDGIALVDKDPSLLKRLR